MATKKKTAKTTTKSKKELEEEVKKLKEKLNKNKQKEKVIRDLTPTIEAIREDLKKQLLDQNKFGKQFDDMIEDYIYFFILKEQLKLDIDVRGVRYISIGGNGFATEKRNESIERLPKINGQMLKILQDLDLKAPDEGGGEEGDDLL